MNTDSNLLECPICFDYFIKPRMLTNCGHTFCEKCIVDMISTLSENIDKEIYIICPTCNIKTYIQSVNNLKMNYIVNDLVQQLINHRNSTVKLNNLSCSCPNSSIIHSLKYDNISNYKNLDSNIENNNISIVNQSNNHDNNISIVNQSNNHDKFKLNNDIFVFEDAEEISNNSRDCCNILKPFSL